MVRLRRYSVDARTRLFTRDDLLDYYFGYAVLVHENERGKIAAWDSRYEDSLWFLHCGVHGTQATQQRTKPGELVHSRS